MNIKDNVIIKLWLTNVSTHPCLTLPLSAGTAIEWKMTRRCLEDPAAAWVFWHSWHRFFFMESWPWLSTGLFSTGGMGRAFPLLGVGQVRVIQRSCGTFTLSSWLLASSTAWDKVFIGTHCQTYSEYFQQCLSIGHAAAAAKSAASSCTPCSTCWASLA